MGTTVVGSTFAAGLTVEQQKTMCDKYPTQFVWVKNTNYCVPRDVCTSGSFEDQKGYCNRTFESVQFHKGPDAKDMVNLYAKIHGLDCKATSKEVECHGLGQDYISCEGNDYMEFEFDDICDSKALSSSSGLEVVACNLIAGGDVGELGDESTCNKITEEKCELIDKTVQRLEATPHYNSDGVYKTCILRRKK